jgi:hypothetical protein
VLHEDDSSEVYRNVAAGKSYALAPLYTCTYVYCIHSPHICVYVSHKSLIKQFISRDISLEKQHPNLCSRICVQHKILNEMSEQVARMEGMRNA